MRLFPPSFLIYLGASGHLGHLALLLLEAMGSKAELGKPLILGGSGQSQSGSPDASPVVLWLHGFGDSPGGWATALQPFRTSIDADWRWIHLCAPLLPQPCFANRKLRAWGQFKTQERIRVGSVDYADEDIVGAYASSVEAVLSELQKLQESVPANRLLIGGFSQGAAVALECALRHPHALAGCIVLSGWARPPARDLLASCKLTDQCQGVTKTPFLLCHGESDDMVDIGCAEAAAEMLRDANLPVQFHKYPGLKHEPCPDLLNVVVEFMCRNLDHPIPSVISWDNESESASEETLMYVSKIQLETLQRQATAGCIDKSSIEELLDPSTLADTEVLVPILVQPKELLSTPPSTAIKAIAESAKGTRETSGSTGLAEITVQEWRRLRDDSIGEQGEEEALSNDEETEGESAENEAGGESDESEQEPPQKRPRVEAASSSTGAGQPDR